MIKNRTYGRRLLAKENLKVKSYWIENLLRNPSTPCIHDRSAKKSDAGVGRERLG
jgi:hypothetical protein